ncbi:MAG: sugar ABC transporter ATP-binding protein [Treponema sp.]|jgi:ribose transport system ATP-binding protein|nr:sugar ABC transporter ATP-binding protein [Treponema sp.]
MNDIILKSEKLNKYFGITHAVKDVSLEFTKGEIHGLIGENGSGKSTFSSMLCGIYGISSGRFILDGKDHKPENLIEANRQGVSIIVQEIGTLPGLTVAENIFLGEETRFMHGPIKDTAAMNNEAQKLLTSYGFERIKASVMIDHYSFEDRKLVEIVKAVYFNPKIVVVDETTTALSQSGREELFKVMEDIKAKGNTVIFISHDLQEVLDHTDRISCLRDGELVGTVKSSDTNTDDLKRMMVGRELDNRYYRTDYDEPQQDEVVLSVKNVSVPDEIQNITFDLHKGEILGFGGLSECGMHEIGKSVFGASYNRTGSVTLQDGSEIHSIPTAIRKNIAYASKDRDNESLVTADTICENICLPSINDLAHRGIIKNKELDQFADKFAKLMSVKMTSIKQDVAELSGGNKQKVVLARWLGKDSDILVLDSPTRGIDVMVKADIYELMNELRQKGKSIIMISEEIPELLGMSDRILIMKDGKINGEFKRDRSLGEEDLIARMV